jgi:hypothetical protein
MCKADTVFVPLSIEKGTSGVVRLDVLVSRRTDVRTRTFSRVMTGTASICLLIAAAACGGPPKAAAPPAHRGHAATTTPLPSTNPSTVPVTATTVATPSSFSVIAGAYIAGTADGGSLYVRFDGASRFSGPDSFACPNCSTASSPLAHLDFSLTTLRPTGEGAYVATGTTTAESDPTWAASLGTNPAGAGPVGSAVSLTVSSTGELNLSFLPMNDVLMKSGGT